ncbi:hypothetical protein BOVMAS10_17070 [Streptococcus uberis]|nr:degenerate integrase [Streptococcus uberis]
MIEIGVDPVNTAKRLGHASSQMTLDTYSHATAVGEDKSIKQFAEYLKKSNLTKQTKSKDFRDGIKKGIKSKNGNKKDTLQMTCKVPVNVDISLILTF